VNELNIKFLVIAAACLAVAMLALPISVAFATAPTTVITGTLTMLDPMSYLENRYLGKSGNWIGTFTDAPFEIHGGIEGTGLYTGHWLMKSIDTPPYFETFVANGVYIMDVEINGASGELTVRLPWSGKEMPQVSSVIVLGGTGGLENLRGTGTMTMIDPLNYQVTINAHWDP